MVLLCSLEYLSSLQYIWISIIIYTSQEDYEIPVDSIPLFCLLSSVFLFYILCIITVITQRNVSGILVCIQMVLICVELEHVENSPVTSVLVCVFCYSYSLMLEV